MSTAQKYNVEVKIDAKTGGLVGEAKAANDEIGKLNDTVKTGGDQYKRTGTEAKNTGEKIRASGNHAKRARSQFNSLAGAVVGMGAAFAAYLALDTAAKIIEAVDNFQLLEVRVARLSDTAADAAANYQFLLDTASATGASLDSSVVLWESLTSSLTELGYTQHDVNQLTESLLKLGTISGTSSEEMSNALRQLGQGFAGGIIRAEEWNSVVEQMPEIWRRVAKASNQSLGDLRNQMLDGKLTADFVLGALESQVEGINDDFEDMPRTVGQAASAFQNSFVSAISAVDKALAGSENLAKLLDASARQLDWIAATYGSLDPDTDNVDAMSVQMANLNDKIAGVNRDLAKMKILYGGNTEEMAKDPAIKRQMKMLEDYQEQLKQVQSKYTLAQFGFDLSGNTDDPYNDKGEKPEKLEKVDPVDENEAKKFAKAKENAEKYAEQIRQRNLNELELIKTRYQEELDTIDEYEQAKYLSAQQAADARAQLELDRDSQVEQYQKQLAEQKTQQERELAIFVEGFAGQRELIELEYQARLDQLKEFQDAELISAQEHAELIKEVEQDRADQIFAIKQAELETQINASRATADGIMAITGDLAGKQSKAYMAMFIVSKSMAIAQGILAMAQNVAEASKVGFPQNIPLIAGATAQGASIISQIKSAQFVGQAHDGITRVPNEGTWNLAKGERVYTNESADQLDRMYERIMNGAGQAAMSVQIVNLIDPSLFGQYLDSANGQQSILNTIDANSTEIASMLA